MKEHCIHFFFEMSRDSQINKAARHCGQAGKAFHRLQLLGTVMTPPRLLKPTGPDL